MSNSHGFTSCTNQIRLATNHVYGMNLVSNKSFEKSKQSISHVRDNSQRLWMNVQYTEDHIYIWNAILFLWIVLNCDLVVWCTFKWLEPWCNFFTKNRCQRNLKLAVNTKYQYIYNIVSIIGTSIALLSSIVLTTLSEDIKYFKR